MKLSKLAVALWFGAAGVAVAGAANAATAQAASTERPIALPAGPAADTLDAFVRQTQFEVVYTPDAVRGVKTRAIKGRYTPRAALNAMLSGTGLVAEPTASGGAAIRPSPVAAASQGDEDAVTIEEVVVTANKREERLKDVASAITAISSQDIKKLGIQDFRDYQTLTPGLSFRDAGQPGVATIILRGLNTGSQQTTNTAAFYIDDTQATTSGFFGVGSIMTPNPDLGDVDRIEVLKGPQGTLYGANSLGGVVRVITKRPNSTAFSGDVTVEGSAVDGGGTGYSIRGGVNVPIIQDKLAARASAFYRQTPGFTDNVGTGAKNVNESELYGARLAIRATPTENLTIDLTAMFQKINNVGSAGTDTVPETGTPLYGEYKYDNFADLSANLETKIFSATVDYDTGIGHWLTTASHAEYETALGYDYTPIYLPLLQLIGIPLPNDSKVFGILRPGMKKNTFETRFASNRLGPIEFVAGAYYTKEKSFYASDVYILDGTSLQPLPGPFGTFIEGGSHGNYEEYAAFANVTWYLTDDVDFTGGARYSHNKQFSQSEGGISFFAPVVGARQPSGSDSPATYLATLRWRPTQDISTYLRAASGYRPGGPQDVTRFPVGTPDYIQADTVWNYEAGVKGSLLGGRMAFDAAVYRIDWKDIQVNSLNGGFVIMANAASARVDGFEGALDFRATRDLTLGLRVGYTNARLLSIDPVAAASVGARAGDKLPLTPEKTLAFFADQRFHILDYPASIGTTVRWQSDMHSGYPSDPLNTDIIVKGYATADVRGDITFGRWTVQGRVENVFDKFGYTSLAVNHVYAGQNNPSQGTVIRPRTFTLSLSTAF
jgi:iron complex outermembrane receptor protein